MTKRQLIDEIVQMNHTAEPGFLAKFEDGDLDDYLKHLRLAQTPRLHGNPHRYDQYFEGCPTVTATTLSATTCEEADPPSDRAQSVESSPVQWQHADSLPPTERISPLFAFEVAEQDGSSTFEESSCQEMSQPEAQQIAVFAESYELSEQAQDDEDIALDLQDETEPISPEPLEPEPIGHWRDLPEEFEDTENIEDAVDKAPVRQTVEEEQEAWLF